MGPEQTCTTVNEQKCTTTNNQVCSAAPTETCTTVYETVCDNNLGYGAASLSTISARGVARRLGKKVAEAEEGEADKEETDDGDEAEGEARKARQLQGITSNSGRTRGNVGVNLGASGRTRGNVGVNLGAFRPVLLSRPQVV